MPLFWANHIFIIFKEIIIKFKYITITFKETVQKKVLSHWLSLSPRLRMLVDLILPVTFLLLMFNIIFNSAYIFGSLTSIFGSSISIFGSSTSIFRSSTSIFRSSTNIVLALLAIFGGLTFFLVLLTLT